MAWHWDSPVTTCNEDLEVIRVTVISNDHCSCKIFVMTIQSDYECTGLFSHFQYQLPSLTKEDKEAMKVFC